jgi:branched-chain amino acid transport system substrate-binding protein
MIRRRSLLASAPAGAGLAIASVPRAYAQGTGVTIGVINDMSGPYADLGGPGSVLGAQMAIEDAGGSVLGQPVRVLSADHKNKPDLATGLVSDWIDRSGVTCIADGGASGAGLAIQQVTRSKKRIFLATGPATSDLTGAACSPYGFHWTYDTYALAQGTASTLIDRGGLTWFFITADYAFGHSVQRDTTAMVTAAGGKVLGGVLVPIASSDFSSYLLQAQNSGAKVVALALGGADLVDGVKQAVEFGLTKSGQVLAGLLTFNTDVQAMGLNAAQGLVVTASYDWEINPEMEAFGKRFMARNSGKPPSMVQAGTYSGVAHYLKAVKAVGSVDADAVATQMRKTKLDDFMSKDAWIREDGRVMRTMYVLSVKSPAESKRPWDIFNVLATIPAEKAFRPLSAGGCPLVKAG